MKHKKHFFTIFFGLIYSIVFFTSSNAQDINCSVQECIDYWAYQFTGEVNSITISGTVTNLTPISGITSVTGNVRIFQSSSLTSLNGLGNITSVGGNLEIYDLSALTNLAGLESLQSVGGYIYIYSNAAQTTLEGLESLTSFNELIIQQNPALTSLAGLESPSVSGSITILGNPIITNMDGLDNLTYLDGNLVISMNDALKNLDGLGSLTSIGGSLTINNNHLLTDLLGLESLTTVTGVIDIQFNELLTKVDGLASLTSVGGNLSLWYSDALTNLDGLKNLSSVGGDINISANPMLVSFCGLYPLFTTGTFGYVGLYENGILFPFEPGGPSQVEQVIALGPCGGSDVTIVSADIKPGSCPNPLNVKSKGVLPVAILGTDDFNVQDIDPTTLLLEGTSPLRWSIEDVATPVIEGEQCDCTTEGPDGFNDLNIKFDSQELVAALGQVNDGDELILTITGSLLDGTAFEGSDCVVIIAKNLNKELTGNLNNVGPDEYTLFGNYPNPFNPSTVIEFAVPVESFIKLEVFNALGEKLNTLIAETLSPGIYSVDWNGTDLSSGVYIYRLQAGSFVDTKKMMLMK